MDKEAAAQTTDEVISWRHKTNKLFFFHMLFNSPVEICDAHKNCQKNSGGGQGHGLYKLMEEKFLKICYP